MRSKGNENEGLRLILSKLSDVRKSDNIVVKPILLFRNTSPNNLDYEHFCCYLKSCHLCHKPFTLNKDIYMYRGDLGFCSVECREQQIYTDEMKEIENISKRRRQMAGTDGGRRCTDGELRHRRRHSNRVIFLLLCAVF